MQNKLKYIESLVIFRLQFFITTYHMIISSNCFICTCEFPVNHGHENTNTITHASHRPDQRSLNTPRGNHKKRLEEKRKGDAFYYK